MLVNKSVESNSHVEFISYTGRFPNLCRGVLTLKIDGEEVSFGHDGKFNFSTRKYNDTNFDDFWSSGGGITSGYNTYKGEWEVDVNDLPEQYRKYAAEIDEVFNCNVPYGCCGGCV